MLIDDVDASAGVTGRARLHHTVRKREREKESEGKELN